MSTKQTSPTSSDWLSRFSNARNRLSSSFSNLEAEGKKAAPTRPRGEFDRLLERTVVAFQELHALSLTCPFLPRDAVRRAAATGDFALPPMPPAALLSSPGDDLPFLTADQQVAWDMGFRLGFAHGLTVQRKQEKAQPPDQSGELRPLFWLVLRAKLCLRTDAELKERTAKHKDFDALLEALTDCGAKCEAENFNYPSGAKNMKTIQVRTLRNRLSGWKTEFHDLLQIVK